MYTITSKVSNDLYDRLGRLGKFTNKTKKGLVRKAIEHFLDDREDYFIALHRLEQKNSRVSLIDLEADNDLES